MFNDPYFLSEEYLEQRRRDLKVLKLHNGVSQRRKTPESEPLPAPPKPTGCLDDLGCPDDGFLTHP